MRCPLNDTIPMTLLQDYRQAKDLTMSLKHNVVNQNSAIFYFLQENLFVVET